MLRLFIAVPIPNIIKEEVSKVRDSLSISKLIHENNYHLTLKFIGEAHNFTYLTIKERLNNVNFNKLNLGLKGVGHFSQKKSKSLWGGVSESRELSSLKSILDEELQDLDIYNSNRVFRPHITIARSHNISSKELSSFLSVHTFFQTDSFEVDSFHLISSKLMPDGAFYQIENIYLLN